MKHLIQFFSALLLSFLASGIHAQETVVSAGAEGEGSGGTSSFTIGQMFFTSYIENNGAVLQGVQQPFEIFTNVGIELTEIKLELSAYPNPTINSLYINIGEYIAEILTYQLYDLQGKLLKNDQITEQTTIIDTQHLPANAYLLNILDNNSIVKTFKIIKKK